MKFYEVLFVFDVETHTGIIIKFIQLNLIFEIHLGGEPWNPLLTTALFHIHTTVFPYIQYTLYRDYLWNTNTHVHFEPGRFNEYKYNNKFRLPVFCNMLNAITLI